MAGCTTAIFLSPIFLSGTAAPNTFFFWQGKFHQGKRQNSGDKKFDNFRNMESGFFGTRFLTSSRVLFAIQGTVSEALSACSMQRWELRHSIICVQICAEASRHLDARTLNLFYLSGGVLVYYNMLHGRKKDKRVFSIYKYTSPSLSRWQMAFKVWENKSSCRDVCDQAWKRKLFQCRVSGSREMTDEAVTPWDRGKTLWKPETRPPLRVCPLVTRRILPSERSL